MSQITTHVLDTSRGKPARELTVLLYQQQSSEWAAIAGGATNKDGRVPDLLGDDAVLSPGVYKLRFATQEYFERHDVPVFYPFVEVIFMVSSKERYHVPLLLSPYGYSTYRGAELP